MAKREDVPMTKVDSGAIAAHGYNRETRTMRVQFRNGGTYDHPDFPEDKYAGFSGSQSLGAFYSKRIKPNHTSKKVG